MMATSLHPFRLIPDKFLRRHDLTAVVADDNDNRKHIARRCRREEVEVGGGIRIPEVVPMRRLFHVDVPEINSGLRPSNSHTLVLRKSSSGDVIDGGFGFTLCGRCPAVVGRVDPGTPAARAGLAAGDLVERINGRNVSRSSADSVATIVRCSGDVIVVDINRPKSTATTSRVTTTDISTTSTSTTTTTKSASAREILYETVYDVNFDEKSSSTLSSGIDVGVRATSGRTRRHVRRRPKQLVDVSPCAAASASVDDERPSRQRDSGYEGCRTSRLYEVDAAAMMTKTGDEDMRQDGGRPEMETMDVDLTRSTEAVYQEIGDVVRSDVVTIDVVVSKTRVDDEVPVSGCSSSRSTSKKSERRLCRYPVGGCDDSGFAKRSPFARRSVDDEDHGTSDEENRPPSSISGNVLDVAFVIASGSSLVSRDRRRLRRRERTSRSWRHCKLSKTTLWDPSISIIRPVDDNDEYRHDDGWSVTSSALSHVTSPPACLGHSVIESALTEHRKCVPSDAAAPAVTRHRKHCPTSSEIVRQIAQCERRFADDLSEGVSRLTRPLRYQGNGVENDVIVSREQHELLFQNIEKLLVTSEYSAHRLSDVSIGDDVLLQVASLYSSQLCSAYKQYCSRLSAAKHVLDELTNNRRFVDFLQVASLTCRSVEDVITRPLQHIHNIRYWLSRLLYVSPMTSSSRDAASRLSDVLSCLDKICDPEHSTVTNAR